MRFVWQNKKPEAKEVVSAGGKKGLSFQEYVKAFETLDPEQKQQFLEKTQKWDQEYSNRSVQEMQNAGLSKAEIQASPEKRHILLSSLYLRRDAQNPNRFTADFKGNYLAEYKAVGWGNVFPWTVQEIKVANKDGEVICEHAVRAIDPQSGKEGYFEASGLNRQPPDYRYVFMYTGYTAEILKTVDATQAAASQKQNSEQASKFSTGRKTREDLSRSVMQGETPEQMVDARLQGLQGRVDEMSRPIESVDVRGLRGKIVSIAEKYANDRSNGRFAADFQSKDFLQGGRLGCAFVVSSILQEAGIPIGQIPGVQGVKAALLQSGWTLAQQGEQPEPGDVVIWPPFPGRVVQGNDGSERVIPGHGHIGISIGHGRTIDNSGPGGPKIGDLLRNRGGVVGLEAILKPPRSASARRAEENPARPFGAAESREPNPKLNASIESKLFPYKFIIAEASKKYGVPVNLIGAVMMQESGADPNIASGAGAGGLMQLMPFIRDENDDKLPTYQTIRRGRFFYLDARDWRADPQKNIMSGVKLLAFLIKKYKGNYENALSAYNWGAGNVDKYLAGQKKQMPAETRGYAPGILAMYRSLEKGSQKA